MKLIVKYLLIINILNFKYKEILIMNKNIFSNRRNIIIASVLAVVIISGSIAGYNYHQGVLAAQAKAAAEAKVDEGATNAYNNYEIQYKGIVDNMPENPTHDELVGAIKELSGIKIDESTITLHDGSIVENNALSKSIADSIEKYKGMLIDSYNADINAAIIDENTATKENLGTSVETLNNIKATIESDKESIDISVDDIINDIDSKVTTYNSKIDELNKVEETANQSTTGNNSYSGGSGSYGSSYRGSGNYSGGSGSGSYGGSYGGSSNDYPESEGWHYSNNYGGIWTRPATPDEEARAIAEAQADGSYVNP